MEQRWEITVTLKDGEQRVMFIEEIEELHDLVEGGPDWNDLKEITIRYNRGAAT